MVNIPLVSTLMVNAKHTMINFSLSDWWQLIKYIL